MRIQPQICTLEIFSKDGRWALFISEMAGSQPPHVGPRPSADWKMFHPPSGWTWNRAIIRAGRRVEGAFTSRRIHDDFQCIYTRAVDPATKRPVGPVVEVQHFHGRLTPQV